MNARMPFLHRDRISRQKPVFEKVQWEQREIMQVKQKDFRLDKVDDVVFCSPKSGAEKIQLSNISKEQPFSFHNKSLTFIHANDLQSPHEMPSEHWEATVTEENGRIKLTNVTFNHHDVFQSIEFKNIILSLEFDLQQGGKYEHKINLDTISANPQISRYAGSDGFDDFEFDKDAELIRRYQIGICQKINYYFKVGPKIISVVVGLSFVFKYAHNDFEPGGAIMAAKVFPQIQFVSFSVNEDELSKYKQSLQAWSFSSNILDISNLLPSGVIMQSVKIKNYRGRVKMAVNVDSTHHVTPQQINGVSYDSNYLGALRAQNLNKIPERFEKQFLAGYSGVGKNILGLFTDSNSSEKDVNRRRPGYYTPTLAPDGTWSSVFDYANYDIKHNIEFNAVFGRQSPINPSNFNNTFINPNSAVINYPDPSSNTNTIKVVKKERQGAYDNIHLHGYLGHYKDNGKLVVHAPICGFCCFHMHWRWSKFNYDVATRFFVQLAKKRFSLSEGRHFYGWDTVQPFAEAGLPLIPFNQHLKIAVTDTSNSYPYDEFDNVCNPNSTQQNLGDIKVVWYCVNVEETDEIFNSHVLMEHGCGYAYKYTDNMLGGIEFLINPPYFISRLEGPIPSYNSYLEEKLSTHFNITKQNYPDFYAALEDYPNSRAAIFEVQYRLMKLYNVLPSSLQSYVDHDQVFGDSNDPNDYTSYSNIDYFANL